MINQQSNALLSEPPPFQDIGNLLEQTKSIDTICQSVSNLSNEACHHIPPPNILPTTYSRGCNRKFNTTWLTKYPFLLYSAKLDGVFCGPCSLFLSSDKRKDNGLLVNRSYSNWSKIGNALSNHSSLLYHLDCVQYTDILKNSIDNPASRIDVMANSDIQMRMDENRHIIRQIVRAILFLGKQGLPFRGDNEDLNITKNPGNFLALPSESDSILFDHLNKTRAKNATYISPRSQNEIINVIGHDIILADIVAEVKQSKFYSVLADEVSCHNVEQLPVCLRFVDSEGSIREEFVAFLKLNRVRAVDIADALVKCLENLGLSLSELRGQGYDGASTMSGHKSGVQARIRESNPRQYTLTVLPIHLIVIVKSCYVPEIRNCIDSIKSITIWVKYSPKREALLKAIAGECTYPASRQTLGGYT